jgi:hypothetical protein
MSALQKDTLLTWFLLTVLCWTAVVAGVALGAAR